MSTITTTDLEGAVEDAAAHLYVWALKDIPQDLRDALAAARDRETSTTGTRILETIHRNVSIADDQKKRIATWSATDQLMADTKRKLSDKYKTNF